MKSVIECLERELKRVNGLLQSTQQRDWSIFGSHGLDKYGSELTEAISILNGEIRESCKKLCPDCNAPYITYTGDEYYECNSCGHTWI